MLIVTHTWMSIKSWLLIRFQVVLQAITCTCVRDVIIQSADPLSLYLITLTYHCGLYAANLCHCGAWITVLIITLVSVLNLHIFFPADPCWPNVRESIHNNWLTRVNLTLVLSTFLALITKQKSPLTPWRSFNLPSRTNRPWLPLYEESPSLYYKY